MFIKISVKPNSKKNSVERIGNNEYKVSVKESAVKGRANLKVRKLLAKELGVSALKINIKNPSSRKKIIEILD